MGERKVIITIGRQYGSGGCEIAERLANDLGINFYDKNILRKNSDESGIKESYFHLADERPGRKLLYKIIDGITPEIKEPTFDSKVVSADNLFRFQSEVIRKLAESESCVIVGRCAEYVLEGSDNLVRVFLYADMDARISRITGKGLYEAKDVKKNIKRIDRERRDYHKYYTGRSWEDFDNYDLVINTAAIGIDGSINLIKDYLKIKGFI